MVANGRGEAEPLEITYKFTFKKGTSKEFHVVLDGWDLTMKHSAGAAPADWTRLGVEQCPNCPLNENENPHCPVAVNMSPVIEFFKDHISSDICDLEIIVPGRSYNKKVPVSEGASALLGLHMATSGCPILDKFKPMVRTHLPFPTLEETLYRMIGMYMVAQYFRCQDNLEPDWEMKGLVDIIADIRIVNRAFCRRLYHVCSQDANLNAVVHLDCFADNSSFFIERKGLDQIRSTYQAYFTKESPAAD